MLINDPSRICPETRQRVNGTTRDMPISFGRILSVAVVLVYAGLAVHFTGLSNSKWLLGALVPLALIWFPEEIGSLTGYYKTGYVNVQTPGLLVSMLGWLLLVGVPLIIYFVTR